MPVSAASPFALAEGTDLVGDYRIRRVLGVGGFGITYLADEIALGRAVTIKEYFPADFAARSGASDVAPRSRECAEEYRWGLERFIEEAQTLARFNHPNIVRVYRYFRANNSGYMVLHFEEGVSFKSWLKDLRRAPRQQELDRLVAPLLDALETIHRGDFLHRDIAPDNIIIRKDGTPVLIDFGSARGDVASHSKTVSALVKPGYSPYEQYASTGRQQGPWTDIYALGATLYHALSGKRPPDAPSRMVHDEYVPARDVALSSYRSGFLAAIDKALTLDLTQRPQSIAEWRGMLLAPEPKAERTRRLSFTLGLRRVRNRDAAKNADTSEPAPVETQPAAIVPAPPDAPQPKGQLLDFIEALRKKQATPAAHSAGAGRASSATPAPPSAAASPGGAQFRLGYGPPPRLFLRPPAEREKGNAGEERQARPRPRPVRAWRRRSWRSIAYKLVVGLGIATLAAAYQDSLPKFESRGAGVVASQVADLAQVVKFAGHDGGVIALAPADQGRWLVSAGADGRMKVWNAGSGALLRIIELDEGVATALAIDDKRALTGHKSGAIVLWDLERAEKLALFQHAGAPISSLTFVGAPGVFAAAGQGGGILLFEVASPSTPAAIDGPDGPAHLVAAAPAGGLLASAGQGRSVRLWRTDTRSLMRTYRGQGGEITALALAPDGHYLAGATANGSVRVWSLSSARAVRSFRAHEGRVTALALAPRERVLATAGEDGTVRLWNLAGARSLRTFTGQGGPVRALSFSPDGRRLIAGSQDGTIRIWTIGTATPRV
jgi:serine/threonine protein kinase